MDLITKVKKSSEKLSENIHIVANDPSLALFRIQEHVRKVIQRILDKRIEVISLQNKLQGHCFDMEYSVRAMKNIEFSDGVFDQVQDMIKHSIFLKQQLKYEQLNNKFDKEYNRNSVYKRFSAQLALDLPDFADITGVMRETTSRMETMMALSKDNNIYSSNNIELQRSHTTLH
ncbi:BLOC-1-related complex subunit 8 homolog [Cochliomyia hominivorax]